jgi:AraC-like DNA-binding protein
MPQTQESFCNQCFNIGLSLFGNTSTFMQNVQELMLSKDPTRIHPSITLTLAKTIDSYGVDSRSLLSGLGIDIDKDLTNEKRVMGSVNDSIWRAAVKATGDDAIGIKFTEHFQIGSLGGLGFCWSASATLLDAFSRLSQYFAVISSAGKITISEEQDLIRVALVLPVPYGVAADPGVDSALALFLHLARLVQGNDLNPVSVHFQRPQPSGYLIFDGFFKCKLQYDASLNELVFEKRDMLKSLLVSNPELARVNDQVVVDYIRKQESENFTSKVSAIIAEDLLLGTPSQLLIAEKLNISSKTLQRRLKTEGINFSSLLNDIRSDLARKYLINEWRAISEVSYLLGFTEPSNFTRWFKSETGLSPVEFRQKQRAEC